MIFLMILQNSCTTQNSLQIIVDYSPGVEVIQDILVPKIIYKLIMFTLFILLECLPEEY